MNAGGAARLPCVMSAEEKRAPRRLSYVNDVHTAEQLTEASASGLRWVSVARVIAELSMVGSMVVLARLIPPSAFGMFAIAVIVQELASTLPSESVGTALVQRRHIGREHLQSGLALGLAIGATLAVIALLLSVVLVRPIFGSQTAVLVAVSGAWFFLGAITAPPTAILRRRLDFRRLSVLDVTNTIVRSGTSVALAVAGLDAGALVLGNLAGVAAMCVLSLIFAPVPLPRLHRQAARDLLGYGGPASLACICWAGFRNGDYAIVGARLGSASAGLYWRGFQLAVEYQRKISQVMTTVAFPVLARTASAEEMFVLRRRMVRLLTLVIFPLLTGLVVLAPVVVPWIFGPAWTSAVLPTQLLAGAGAATVVIDSVGTVFMATGRSRAILGFGVGHFVVYIAIVLVASRWGVTGVSIAASSVHLVFVVVAYRMLLHGRPEKTLRFLWQDVSAATVACVAMAGVAVPVEMALRTSGAPAVAHLVLVGAAGAAAYLLALRLWFRAAWADLMTLVRRVLPIRRAQAVARRVPLLAGRSG
jgi:O-antigen/teichoic acid export membrane protein